MKKIYLAGLTYCALMLLSVTVKGQCINTFPYTNNFESFDSLSHDETCNTTIIGDTADGWTQDAGDGGEWRSDSAGTPSLGTGPGARAGTSGIGTGTDYKPGTTSGTYLYTEGTSATGCPNAEVNLLSPCFDFSGTKYYKLSFAYHMFGGGMGTLHIDVLDSNQWVRSVWSLGGNQDTNWHEASVNLARFNKSSTQIRFRFVMGSTFATDCAIDAIKIEEFAAPVYDAQMIEVTRTSQTEYYHIPYPQADSVDWTVVVKNEGLKKITSVRAVASASGLSDSISIGDMNAFSIDTAASSRLLGVNGTSGGSIKINVRMNESDDVPGNNSMVFETGLNDTVYSREDGSMAGGIGFNGAAGGEIGQMFEIQTQDTLTSVTFGLLNGTVGDSLLAVLYTYSGTAPDTMITFTKSVVVVAGTPWYTIHFDCEQVLKPGKYFVSIRQLATNNMSLGYNTNFYTLNSAFYNGGGGWVELGGAGFEVSLAVRMNFGEVEFPEVSIASLDSVCSGVDLLVKGEGAFSYSWKPAHLFDNPLSTFTKASSDTSFTITVTGTNTCGFASDAEKRIKVNPIPSGTISNDTLACVGDVIPLRASGGSSYKWVNGPADQTWNYTVSSDRYVEVVIDSTNGCQRRLGVNVSASAPVPVTTDDTTICQAQPLDLMSSGGATYSWENGPMTANYSVNPLFSNVYRVELADSLGCKTEDSVVVTVLPGPTITTSNDTGVCFGNRVKLWADGGVSYQWEKGPATAEYDLLPIISKTYFVDVEAANGCSLRDSVRVNVGTIPLVDLRDDTTICEGTNLALEAMTLNDVRFDWNTGDTTNIINISPTEETRYKVRVFNAIGCESEDSVLISVDPLANASFDYTLNVRSVTFKNNSENADDYKWYFDDGDSSSDENPFHKYKLDGTYNVKLVVSNNCGSNDTSVSIKIENLGIEDLALEGLSIYPNPTDRMLTVEFVSELNEDVSLSINALNGQVLKSERFEKLNGHFIQHLDLSDLSSGLYMIDIVHGPYHTVQKLIIK